MHDEKYLPAHADRSVATVPDVMADHGVVDHALQPADHVLNHRRPRDMPHGRHERALDDRAIVFVFFGRCRRNDERLGAGRSVSSHRVCGSCVRAHHSKIPLSITFSKPTYFDTDMAAASAEEITGMNSKSTRSDQCAAQASSCDRSSQRIS
jgi:hypothetical protein